MPEPELVGDKDAPAKPPDSGDKPGGEKKPDKPDKPSRDYEKELSDLKAQRDEYQQAAQHWYSKAQGILPNGETPPDDEEEEDEKPARGKRKAEPEDDEDADSYVTKLTTKGPKAVDERIEKFLRKQGFVSRDEMESVIERERERLTRETKLYSMFPDLQNEDSDLFKETAKEYKRMVGMDPKLAKSQAAIQIAAEAASSRLKASRPQESEAERRRRIDAQSGDLGRRGDFDEEPDELTEAQKTMIRKFNDQGGVQVSEESLKKRLRDGIRMVYDPRRDTSRRAG